MRSMRWAATPAAAALLAAAAAAVLLAPAHDARGHGVGYELLDPVPIDGVGPAALEVQSTQGDGGDGGAREVRLALLNAATGVTIRDVTFELTAAKTGTELFGGTFRSGDGTLVLVLDGSGDPSGVEIVDEGKRGGLLESLVGLDETVVRARGGPLAAGGLYLFDVSIATAGSFDRSLDPPARFAAGLSIPDTTTYAIDDADFGRQEISVITYYDTIGGFEYGPALGSVSFEMPFAWNAANINETSVVHEELSFDRRFGDMMASRYEASVNGVQMPDRVVTIDDLSLDGGRIVHMVLNQNDLQRLFEKERASGPEGYGGLMKFRLEAGERAPLGATVDNGQFRVSVGWDPWHIKSGGDVEFGFNITDVFLRDRPVSAEYDVSLVHEGTGAVIASASGTTDASLDAGARLAASIPEGMGGPAVLRFEPGHRRGGEAHHVEGADEVDLDHPAELGERHRAVAPDDPRRRADAGAVDDDARRADGLRGPAQRRLHGLRRGHVAGEADPPELAAHRLRALGVQVEHGDPGALAREPPRRRRPEPGGPARHQRRRIVQPHLRLPGLRAAASLHRFPACL